MKSNRNAPAHTSFSTPDPSRANTNHLQRRRSPSKRCPSDTPAPHNSGIDVRKIHTALRLGQHGLLLQQRPLEGRRPRPLLPSPRRLRLLLRARFLLLLGASCLAILLWRSLHASSAPGGGSSRWAGPRTSPADMTPNEAAWAARHATPVTFAGQLNPHAPVAVGADTVARVDLNGVRSTRGAAAARERVLLLTPLRDAARHLGRYFDLLDALTYPHELVDLAFLVSNSADDTLAAPAAELNRVQEGRDGRTPFRSATVVEKDFEVVGSQEVNDRHGWKMQGPRRKTMGRARNYLLATALRPDHSWVYWRDVDIADSPPRILEDFMEHDKDVIVPNIWFHRFKPNDKGKMVDVEGRCWFSPLPRMIWLTRLCSRLQLVAGNAQVA